MIKIYGPVAEEGMGELGGMGGTGMVAGGGMGMGGGMGPGGEMGGVPGEGMGMGGETQNAGMGVPPGNPGAQQAV
jgi:hypothetical protein